MTSCQDHNLEYVLFCFPGSRPKSNRLSPTRARVRRSRPSSADSQVIVGSYCSVWCLEKVSSRLSWANIAEAIQVRASISSVRIEAAHLATCTWTSRCDWRRLALWWPKSNGYSRFCSLAHFWLIRNGLWPRNSIVFRKCFLNFDTPWTFG